jgi:hypothetical protein
MPYQDDEDCLHRAKRPPNKKHLVKPHPNPDGELNFQLGDQEGGRRVIIAIFLYIFVVERICESLLGHSVEKDGVMINLFIISNSIY